MVTSKEMVAEMLYTNPLPLLAIKDKQVIKEINELIPYSTAFEIECDMVGIRDEHISYTEQTIIVKKHADIFKEIPDILDVQNDHWEQRYRIPNGLKGIICLYHISKQLKLNSLLNPKSSIHYHVDCTDCFDEITPIVRRSNNTEYILSELDTWLEGDTANSREIGSWFKLNSLQTIEFRLGEMTFEYGRLLKRIVHCNKIVKKFKDQIPSAREVTFEEPDARKLIAYNKANNFNIPNKWDSRMARLNQELHKLEQQNKVEIPEVKITEDVQSIVTNRVHKLY